MPHRIVIDVVRRLVYVQVTDLVTGAELLAMRTELAERPEFDSTFNAIVDLRTADLSSLTGEQIQAVARASAFAPSARRAIVADTAGKFGLARMYEIRRELAGGGESTGVFMELADALAWLGLDSPPHERIPSGLADPHR